MVAPSFRQRCGCARYQACRDLRAGCELGFLEFVFLLLIDGVEIEGREIEMVGPGFGGGAALWGEEPGVGPEEDVGVCGPGRGVIVLAGDIEVEVDEGLGVGFEEGGVAEDVRVYD